VIHLDTSYLVDILRETARGTPGAAASFLRGVAEEEVRISVFVACELAAGAEASNRRGSESERVAELCRLFSIEYPDERFAPAFGRLAALQKRAGDRIDTMDLLIATMAVVADAPLVTRNVRHFARVPGLRVLAY
jgi:predicted nucleic acid-binding protein